MAQPLDARIASAMGEGARAATVLELIGEVGTAIAEAQAEHDIKDAASKSVTAPEAEADAFADEAAKLARRIIRLQAKREQLEQRHESLMESERRKRALEDYAQIKVARDKLADDIRDRWPALTGEIVSLLQRIVASDAEIERANRNRYGEAPLESAEAVARDCPGNFSRVGPIPRFTAMKIPGLAELVWPPHKPHPLQATDDAYRNQRLRAEQERAAENARWSRYVVTPPRGKNVAIETRRGIALLQGRVIVAEMLDEHVESARQSGCKVELAKPGEPIGTPAAVASF